MSAIKAPARLPDLVKTAFNKALADGELLYFPTQVQDLRVGSLSVRHTFHYPPPTSLTLSLMQNQFLSHNS